ncbi:MAG TPA: hypothetical protein VFB59_01510 [Candidatus Saccharimonadales bacterium]|nr:hypothetical protein [Candidatus Saccharimonadales bacterium]
MLHKSLLILGRQPALGRAELESLFGPDSLQPVGQQAVACTLPWEEVPFGRLGGSIRLAKLLAIFDTLEWREIARNLAKDLRTQLGALPEGKVKLGLSVFGLDVKPQQLIATGLELKKVCRQAGRSARVVPNTGAELSSAQVFHNQLTGDLGIELLLIKSGSQVYVAQTKKVQDIEAYARRDQQRPKRDARVGMLPPKLAQIIVNVATGTTDPLLGAVVYDPFCGTGVVLQEASLMGFDISGSDIDPRMVAYTDQNLQWMLSLPQNRVVPHSPDNRWYSLAELDATKDDFPSHLLNIIASETYLGRPFTSSPSSEMLVQTVHDVNVIIKKFLQNVARQTKPGFRLCIAVPAWQTNQGLRHLPLLDHLNELGYNRVKFEYAKAEELVYHRPEQIVARELLVITRK